MNSRDRVRLALDHKEPDRVPFDLCGTPVSLIHVTAYQNLRRYLNVPYLPPRVVLTAEQITVLDEDVADRLETDVRVVFPGPPAGFRVEFVDEGAYESYGDEWGVRWRMPKDGGFYYDMYYHPLAQAESLADLRAFKFPDPVDPQRFVGMRQRAEAAAAKGKAITLSGAASGIVEVYSWLRGYEQFYTDLAVHPDWVAYMVDRMVEFKMAYWERALQEVGDLVDVVLEFDDMAGQQTLLFSPVTYRKVIKPRHQRLFARIHQLAPTAKLFLHSCGAIRPLILDLIEIGVDILNPVQISAAGMNLRELKRDFGRDIVFWGGGVDTQGVLGTATPEQVKAHVRGNIEALAPGGGFIFAPVHDVQANVPPENLIAMWEAWREFGGYPTS
jgi:uroporphyrinogen decarboxylase